MSHEYSQLVQELRQNFRNGVTTSLEARLMQLKQLHQMLANHEDELYDALQKDLRKCRVESNIAELMQVRIDLGNAVQGLSSWMEAEKVPSDPINTCELRREPLGVVLIIATWNYPIQLTFLPLIGALAAGNCVVVKPSEHAPHCSALFSKLIGQYLSPDIVKVVKGAVPETTSLLKERFDLIFYTGSTAAGKIVMRAAAEHLTPVVLELGGKCPAIVDGSSNNMEVVTQRLAWGKFSNSGQTCIAPDYVLFVGDNIDEFVNALKKTIVKFYGENPKESDSYGRIINVRHFKRVCALVDASKVVYGNVRDEDDLYISPTIMTNVTANDAIMQEEIFGPVLPILQVKSAEEATKFVNSGEKPLAVYVFSTNYEFTEKISNATSSGGVCVNDCIIHAAVPNLPFGGVGHSGMGRYHGKSSFQTFSNTKSYMYRNKVLKGTNGIGYPPHGPDHLVLENFEFRGMPSKK